MRIFTVLLLKTEVFLCFFSFSSLSAQPDQERNFVTYEFSGGRFGDNLLAYLHARWISYQYQIPLLYKDFPYSSQLVLDDMEIKYDFENYKTLSAEYLKENFDTGIFTKENSRLYICNYFAESSWERENFLPPSGEKFYFPVDWKDPEFRKILKKLISPKEELFLTIPPKDCINIALHFREGGGYDTGDFTLGFLTKFPPIEFYIQGLLQVVDRFQGESLYCYLFTDALDPLSIIEKFKNKMPDDTQITFDCRSRANFHNQNVLEDFFSLFLFDVLIHPQSNFSLIPSLIHDYAITYSPVSGKREGIDVIIDNTKLEINKELYRDLKGRDKIIQELEGTIQELEGIIQELEGIIQELEGTSQEQGRTSQEQGRIIQEQGRIIQALRGEIRRLKRKALRK